MLGKCMKKLLLLSLLAITAVQAMEQEIIPSGKSEVAETSGFMTLPPEIQLKILMELPYSGKDLDDSVANIKNFLSAHPQLLPFIDRKIVLELMIALAERWNVTLDFVMFTFKKGSHPQALNHFYELANGITKQYQEAMLNFKNGKPKRDENRFFIDEELRQNTIWKKPELAISSRIKLLELGLDPKYAFINRERVKETLLTNVIKKIHRLISQASTSSPRDRIKEKLIALINAGADVDLPDGEGNTPLMLAQKYGLPDSVIQLLKAKEVSHRTFITPQEILKATFSLYDIDQVAKEKNGEASPTDTDTLWKLIHKLSRWAEVYQEDLNKKEYALDALKNIQQRLDSQFPKWRTLYRK
jgi:hypothetical protein